MCEVPPKLRPQTIRSPHIHNEYLSEGASLVQTQSEIIKIKTTIYSNSIFDHIKNINILKSSSLSFSFIFFFFLDFINVKT